MAKRWIYILLLSLVIGMTLCIYVGAYEQIADVSDSGEELPVTLIVHKVDGQTQLPVADAEFILSSESGTYLALETNGNGFRWVTSREKATTFVTDQDGLILLEGILPGTYYLTETKAPDGYNMLEESLKIQLTAQYATVSSGTVEITELRAQVNDGEPLCSSREDPDTVEITVENIYGTTLPETGGLGTMIYYMLGVIILFAVALTFASKRLVKQDA